MLMDQVGWVSPQADAGTIRWGVVSWEVLVDGPARKLQARSSCRQSKVVRPWWRRYSGTFSGRSVVSRLSKLSLPNPPPSTLIS